MAMCVNKPLNSNRRGGPIPTQIDWDAVNGLIRDYRKGPYIAAKLGIDVRVLRSACLREHGIEWASYAAKVRNQGALFRFSPFEVERILKIYYQVPLHQLLSQDKVESLWGSMAKGEVVGCHAIRYDLDARRSEKIDLLQKLQWHDVHRAVSELQSRPFVVNGVSQDGWFDYILRCWVEVEDPTAEHNADRPMLEPAELQKHQTQALIRFCNLLADRL